MFVNTVCSLTLHYVCNKLNIEYVINFINKLFLSITSIRFHTLTL